MSAVALLSPMSLPIDSGWQPRRPPWQFNLQAIAIIFLIAILCCISPTSAVSSDTDIIYGNETADVNASDDKCLFNPLFHKPLAMFHHSPLPFPSKPTSVPDSAKFLRSCKTLNASAPTLRSCCNSSTVAKFRHFAEEYDKTRLDFANIINSITADSLYHYFVDDQARPLFHMSQQQNQSVTRIVYDLSMIADNLAQCSDAMMTYWQGMFCLACSENSARYQSESKEFGTVLRLQQSTCDAVWSACEPVVESVVVAIPDIIDAFTPFLNDDSNNPNNIDCMTRFQSQVTSIIAP